MVCSAQRCQLQLFSTTVLCSDHSTANGTIILSFDEVYDLAQSLWRTNGMDPRQVSQSTAAFATE